MPFARRSSSNAPADYPSPFLRRVIRLLRPCVLAGKQRRAFRKGLQKLQQFARRVIRDFGLLNELNRLLKTALAIGADNCAPRSAASRSIIVSYNLTSSSIIRICRLRHLRAK
jgi:hypothetical protein